MRPSGCSIAAARRSRKGRSLRWTVEVLGKPQQLLVQPAQCLLGHGGARLATHGAVELVLAGLRRGADRLLQRLVRVGHLLVGLGGHRLGVLLAHHLLGLELVRVELAHGRVLLDPLVHERLGVGRLVGLVVPEAPVADEVDERVAVEGLAEGVGQADGRDAGLHVVGVHVDDRDVEALRQVGRVARGAALVRIGGEAELVVGDHVDRASGRVAGKRLEVQRLRHDPLAREGRVAVDQHRQDRRRVVGQLARLAAGLVGARPALDHRVHVLEVAGVGGEGHGHAAPLLGDVGARRPVVVLHVAGAARGGGRVHRECALALELGQDRLVRPLDRMRQHVQAPAVGHAHHHLAGPVLRGQLDRLVEHRHQRVETFDRELLLAQERLVQIALERLHLGQARQQAAPVLAVERLAVGAGLHGLPQPDPLLVVGDVLQLVGDRARVGVAQAREGVGEGVARHRHAEHRRRDAAHQFVGEADRGRVERGIAERGRAQRVEPGGQVAVHAVRLDHRRRRLHGLQQRGIGHRRGGRCGGGGHRLGRGHGRRPPRLPPPPAGGRAPPEPRRRSRPRPEAAGRSGAGTSRTRRPGSPGGRRCS